MVAAFFRPLISAVADAPSICPNFGAGLCGSKDEWVVRGRFTFRPGDGLFIDGVRLKCSRRVHEVIGCIFLAAPSVVPKEVIASRFRDSGDPPIRLIDVYLTQARKAARALGEDLPIETRIGLGVTWADQYVTA